MIKRYYFYHFTLQSKTPKFCCGVMTVASWFQNPSEAFRLASDHVQKLWGCDESAILCNTFNKV